MNASASGFLTPSSDLLLGQGGVSAPAILAEWTGVTGEKVAAGRPAQGCHCGPVNQSSSLSRSVSPQNHKLKENSVLLFRDF